MRTTRWLGLGMMVLVGMALVAMAGCGNKEAEKGKAAPKMKLPDAVAKALKAEFPKAEVTEVAKEKEGGVPFYDIDFRDGSAERAIFIAADGTILSVSLIVEAKDVPEAVVKAIAAAAGDGKVKQYERREVRQVGKDLQITKLDKPVTQYEAELTKGDLEAAVVVDDQGKVVEEPKWEKAEKE